MMVAPVKSCDGRVMLLLVVGLSTILHGVMLLLLLHVHHALLRFEVHGQVCQVRPFLLQHVLLLLLLQVVMLLLHLVRGRGGGN